MWPDFRARFLTLLKLRNSMLAGMLFLLYSGLKKREELCYSK